jgi:spore coat polysaccharide biosynthesis protein SpsF (cytidylyltransferase family)
VSALAVVQARMSSTRLPGKVLADVGGEPLLALLVARLMRARTLDAIVVATSDDPSDDPIAELVPSLGARLHRGDLHDVLHRFATAVAGHDGTVVRITADCPLIDPALVDEVVALREDTPGCRYASNIEPRTYPDGLDVEALDAALLRELDATVAEPELREHVTLTIRRDLDAHGAAAIVHEPDLGDLRWTVDTPEDLEFVRGVVERLGERRHTAGLDEILAAL